MHTRSCCIFDNKATFMKHRVAYRSKVSLCNRGRRRGALSSFNVFVGNKLNLNVDILDK